MGEQPSACSTSATIWHQKGFRHILDRGVQLASQRWQARHSLLGARACSQTGGIA